MYVSLNGRTCREEKLPHSFFNEAFLYGYGIFETIKFVDDKLFFFEEHMERLYNSCQLIDLKINTQLLALHSVRATCQELIELNQIQAGAVRISYVKNHHDCLLLIVIKDQIYSPSRYEKGFHLAYAKIKRNPYSPLTKVKSNNYLENILARRRVLEQGYDEALFLNVYDEICEGSISNIFFVKDEIIFTPAIECGVLPGIIRKQVLELIRDLGLRVQVGRYEREFAVTVDEIFITNSLMDIMPVTRLEDRSLDIKRNTMTNFLREQLKKREKLSKTF